MNSLGKKFQKTLWRLVKEEKRKKLVDIIRATGIPQSTMSAILNGKHQCNEEKRAQIAGCFKMTLDEFMTYLDTLNKEAETKKGESEITEMHQNLVAQFEHKQEGYAANQALLKIEALDKAEFFRVVAELKIKAIELENEGRCSGKLLGEGIKKMSGS